MEGVRKRGAEVVKALRGWLVIELRARRRVNIVFAGWFVGGGWFGLIARVLQCYLIVEAQLMNRSTQPAITQNVNDLRRLIELGRSLACR